MPLYPLSNLETSIPACLLPWRLCVKSFALSLIRGRCVFFSSSFQFFFLKKKKKIIQGYFMSECSKKWILVSGILASSTVWERYWGNESWFVLKETVSQAIASHIPGAGMQTLNEAGTSMKITHDGEGEGTESQTRILFFFSWSLPGSSYVMLDK